MPPLWPPSPRTPRLTLPRPYSPSGSVRVEIPQVGGSFFVRDPGDREGIALDLREIPLSQVDGLGDGNEIFADVARKVRRVVRVHRDPQRPVEHGLDLVCLQAVAHVAV